MQSDKLQDTPDYFCRDASYLVAILLCWTGRPEEWNIQQIVELHRKALVHAPLGPGGSSWMDKGERLGTVPWPWLTERLDNMPWP